MTKAEYVARTKELCYEFLEEKAAGLIPLNMGWGAWCLHKGYYPLDDAENDEHQTWAWPTMPAGAFKDVH